MARKKGIVTNPNCLTCIAISGVRRQPAPDVKLKKVRNLLYESKQYLYLFDDEYAI